MAMPESAGGPAPLRAWARARAAASAWTEPHPAVGDPEVRRRARLLTALLLVTIPLAFLASMLAPLLSGSGKPLLEEPTALGGLATSSLGFVAYALSRTRHTCAAAHLTVGLAVLGTWMPMVLGVDTARADAAPYFLGISVILSALLLPLASTAAVAALNLAAVVALPGVVPGLDGFDAGNAALLLAFTSAFILVFGAVRRQDLRQIEAQAQGLAENEARLRSIVTHAPDIIMMVDRDGHIRYINRTVPGLTPEAVLGTTLYDYLQDADRDRVAALLATVFATGEAQGFEVQVRPPHGPTAWYASRLGPILRDGEVVAATLITTDVSDLKAADEERARAREAAREVDQLREAAKFRANFINMAAHELRTPMTPIKTQMYILKKHRAAQFDAEERRAFELLERNVTRLTALLRDLLDSARIQSGKADLTMAPLDLAAIAAEAVELHRAAAVQSSVALDVDLPARLPVRGDAMRLSQVLFNLLGNALKFTPPGGQVHVALADEGGEAVVRVRDTGLGVEPEQLARLFQPFSQLRFAADQSSEGTGLGLYICKEFVERHGGRIWCESPGKGQGCTFGFALPLAPAADQAAAVNPPATVPAAARAGDPG